MKIENLLPIGSVVTVKDANKSMVIIGILTEHLGERYDYIAVLDPEGYLSQDEIFLFNHEDIARVEFLGFMNSEFQVFRQSVASLMENETGTGSAKQK